MSARAIDRRTLLRTSAAALLGTGAAGLLSACGGGADELGAQARAVARRSIAIDYASYYPPVADLRHLVDQRARVVGARVTFSDDASGIAAQRATLRGWSGPRGGFRALVVAPFDAAAVAPIVDDALARGIDVVSYLAPLPRQTARIVVDPAAAGRQLAADAAAWAHRALRGRGQLLLVRPPADLRVPDPFAVLAAPIERALLATLARTAPGLEPVAVTEATAAADARAAVARALQDYPHVRLALCFNDATAAGAADALAHAHAAADRPRLYAGGVALGGVATGRTLRQLSAGGVLRALVAPRLRDLADALVDVPYALLHGQPSRDAEIEARVLAAGDTELIAAYRHDYANG